MGFQDTGYRIRKEIQILITAGLLLAFSISVVPTLAVIFFIYRKFVRIMANLFRPDLDKFLNGLSNLCAIDDIEKNPKVNLLGFVKMDASMDMDTFRALFEQRVINLTKPGGELKYPELRQSWTSFMGYYFWKWDRGFNLNNHVREYDYLGELALPSPCTDEDLRRVMGGLLAKPWKAGQSAWEILFVNNFDPCPESSGEKKYVTAVGFRLHHTMGDGYSFLKLFLQDLAGAKDGVPKVNFPKSSLWEKLLTAISLPLMIPYQIAEEAVQSADGYNSWHLTDTKLSREYHTAMSSSISIDTIKEIRRKHGANYNAVLCAALAGGIRKVMNAAGQTVPSSISCLVPIPLPNHTGGLVIHAASVFTKIPLRVKNPAECLHHINETMKKAKVPAHLFGQVLFMKYIGIAPIFHNRMLRNKVSSTIALSCFPGPENPPPFLGANITDVLVGCGLGAGKTGAFVILFSYAGKQRFVVNIDKTVFPSEKIFSNLGRYLEEELEMMLKGEVHVPLNTVGDLNIV